jgi:hypothetical protein
MLAWPQWFMQFQAQNPGVSPADAYKWYQSGAAPTFQGQVSGDMVQAAGAPPVNNQPAPPAMSVNGGLNSTNGDFQDYGTGGGGNAFSSGAGNRSNVSIASLPQGISSRLPEGETPSVVNPMTGQIMQNPTPYGEKSAGQSLFQAMSEGMGAPIMALAGGAAFGGLGAGTQATTAGNGMLTEEQALANMSGQGVGGSGAIANSPFAPLAEAAPETAVPGAATTAGTSATAGTTGGILGTGVTGGEALTGAGGLGALSTSMMGGGGDGGSPIPNSPFNLNSQAPGTGQNIMTNAGGNVDYTGSGQAQQPQIDFSNANPVNNPFNTPITGGSGVSGSPFNVGTDGSVGNTSYGMGGMQGQGDSPFDVGTTTTGQDALGGGGTVGTTIGGMPTGDGVPVGTGTATGGSLLDHLTNLGTSALNGALPGVINGVVNGALGNRTNQQAAQLLQSQNPLDQAQRKPFQDAATNMVNNPSSYFQNNPFAKAFGDYMQNNVVPRNIAGSGNVGNVLDRAGSATATALGANYNQLLQSLQGFGGYNMQNPAVASGAALMSQGNQQTAEATRGVGDIAAKIFGTPSNPQTPQANAQTGSYDTTRIT